MIQYEKNIINPLKVQILNNLLGKHFKNASQGL